MTTATTAYHKYQSPSAWRDTYLHDDAFDEPEQREVQPNLTRGAEQTALKAKVSTILAEFLVELDFDTAIHLTKIASLTEPQVELPLFVSSQPKSVRNVRFHVKKRVAWSPNPVLPDYGE